MPRKKRKSGIQNNNKIKQTLKLLREIPKIKKLVVILKVNGS